MHLSLAHWQNAFIPRPCYGKIICHLNFSICWPKPMVLLFKCNPFSRTFAQYYLFCRIFQKEIWTSLEVFLLATIMKETDKFGLNLTTQLNPIHLMKKIAEGNVQNLSSWQGWVEAKNNNTNTYLLKQTIWKKIFLKKQPEDCYSLCRPSNIQSLGDLFLFLTVQ